jgi:hypothetical protein
MLKKFLSCFGRTTVVFLISFVFITVGQNIALAATALPAGGNGFDTAVTLQPGSYQGGPTAEGSDVFYAISVKAGQELKINGDFQPAEPAYGVMNTITLYDANRNELQSNFDEPVVVYWLPGSESANYKYYIRITDNTWDTASALINIALIDRYDVGTQVDAGESFEKALTVGTGNHQGYLSYDGKGTDTKDYYKISVNQGVTYEFKATPASGDTMSLQLFNLNRALLKEEESANEGAIVSTSLTSASNTNVFLVVSNYYERRDGEISNYKLNITASSSQLTNFYSCEGDYCTSVGGFASKAVCEQSTTKVCYQTETCDSQCGKNPPILPPVLPPVLPPILPPVFPPEPVCQNDCSVNQTKCFDNFNYYRCGNFDEDGCSDWSTPVYCGEGNKCEDGKCVKAKDCACSAWVNVKCDKTNCDKGEVSQIRTCMPENCDITNQCMADASCGGFSNPFAFFGGWGWFSGWYFFFGLMCYVYFALCLQFLAKKTNTADGWLAWIPIAQIFLMVNIAGKPWWWFFFMLIPGVNIVMAVIIWMLIAEKRGQPNWLGLLILVPVIGIAIPGYLAFSDASIISKASGPKDDAKRSSTESGEDKKER